MMNGYKNIGDRLEHLTYAFNNSEIDGLVLEFGVYKGVTINHLASLTKDLIHGFDSFEGLPEPWDKGRGVIYPPERFLVDKIPEVKNNVQLYKGWFNETIPMWKFYWYTDPIKLLHIDSDLYSSCKTILNELNEQIVSGTIIVFDELIGYHNWKEGEWKALKEWETEFNRKWTWLGKGGKYSASIKVTK